MKYPRSPYKKVEGLVYFGRMLDKIRLAQAGELHPELHNNLGKGFDKRCVDFFGVPYDELAGQVRAGLDDKAAFDWCQAHGKSRNAEEIEIWSEFMRKRGWNDDGAEFLAKRKKESGFENRDDIKTMFDYIVADEAK